MTPFGRVCWNPSTQRPAATFWFIKCAKTRRCVPTLRRRPRRAGKPLLRLSASVHQATWGGKFIYVPHPGQFLHYIKNAACVITDSFHGTAFSLRFGVPFAEVLPTNCTGTCNHSLLTLTGLQSRLVTDRPTRPSPLRPSTTPRCTKKLKRLEPLPYPYCESDRK